jgi:hypothetical protein
MNTSHGLTFSTGKPQMARLIKLRVRHLTFMDATKKGG